MIPHTVLTEKLNKELKKIKIISIFTIPFKDKILFKIRNDNSSYHFFLCQKLREIDT